MTRSTQIIWNNFWICAILGPLLLIAGIALAYADLTSPLAPGLRSWARDSLLILFGLVLMVRAVDLRRRASHGERP